MRRGSAPNPARGWASGPPSIFIRHHRPVIDAGVCYGRLDVCAEPGRIPKLRHATVWSSPARRCLSLAIPIAAAHRRKPRIEPRLLELDFAAWEGLRWDDISRTRLDAWARAPLARGAPGGETGAALIRRVRSFARLLINRPGRHVVVAHAGPLVVLEQILAGRRPDLLAPRPPFGVAYRPRPRRSLTSATSSLAR